MSVVLEETSERAGGNGKGASITDIRERMGELATRMREHPMNLYMAAKEEKLPHLSAFLEKQQPSSAEERKQGLDAFTRLLVVADIKTRSDPAGTYQADTFQKLAEHPLGRGLWPELSRRWWNEALWLQSQRRADGRAPALVLSGDYGLGTVQRPYTDELDQGDLVELAPQIPLAEVVARTIGLDTPDYRAPYLIDPTTDDIRMKRVAEATELPKAKIVTGQRSISLYKFGRALEVSYETLRRMRLDEIRLYIRLLAIQTEVDQVAAAVDVMINGDGNSGTSATSYNLTTLDAGTTANNWTALAWLAWQLKWRNPYMITTVLGLEAMVLKMLAITLANANLLLGAAAVPAPFSTAFTPLGRYTAGGVRYGVLDTAPANKLVGFDRRFAVERAVENDSDISEADRFITRQTEVQTFSFNEGYRVWRPNASKVVAVNA